MITMQNKTGAGKRDRVWYFDWLKLIAAVLVVFYHLAYYDLDYGFVPGSFYLPNGNRIIMSFAACSVPVFFMVNGALLFRRHRNWKDMLKKAAKILVLMVVWKLADFPSWFFRTLVILYLIFPVLQYFREHRPVLLKLLCAAVAVMPFGYNLLLMLLKGLALGGCMPDVTHGMSVTGCFTMYSILYFCLGAWFDEMEPWPLSRSLGFVIAGWVLVVAECVIYTNLYQSMWDAVNSAFPTVGALLMAMGMFMAARHLHLSWEARFLSWASEGVLAIYLMHMAGIHLLRPLIAVRTYGLLTAIAAAVAVSASCVLVQKLCKRIPLLSWLLKI